MKFKIGDRVKIIKVDGDKELQKQHSNSIGCIGTIKYIVSSIPEYPYQVMFGKNHTLMCNDNELMLYNKHCQFMLFDL